MSFEVLVLATSYHKFEYNVVGWDMCLYLRGKCVLLCSVPSAPITMVIQKEITPEFFFTLLGSLIKQKILR